MSDAIPRMQLFGLTYIFEDVGVNKATGYLSCLRTSKMREKTHGKILFTKILFSSKQAMAKKNLEYLKDIISTLGYCISQKML